MTLTHLTTIQFIFFCKGKCPEDDGLRVETRSPTRLGKLLAVMNKTRTD